jgi:hypothetical protein
LACLRFYYEFSCALPVEIILKEDWSGLILGLLIIKVREFLKLSKLLYAAEPCFARSSASRLFGENQTQIKNEIKNSDYEKIITTANLHGAIFHTN